MNVVAQVLNLLLDLAHLFLCLVGLRLKIHFEFFVLLFILLERLLAFLELVLLHDNVLTQRFGFLHLVVDLDLGQQDFTRVLNEITNALFLLPTLIQILDSLWSINLARLRRID